MKATPDPSRRNPRSQNWLSGTFQVFLSWRHAGKKIQNRTKSRNPRDGTTEVVANGRLSAPTRPGAWLTDSQCHSKRLTSLQRPLLTTRSISLREIPISTSMKSSDPLSSTIALRTSRRRRSAATSRTNCSKNVGWIIRIVFPMLIQTTADPRSARPRASLSTIRVIGLLSESEKPLHL